MGWTRRVVMSALCFAGCAGHVQQDFDNVYQAAMAEPTLSPDMEYPDATLFLSADAVRRGFAAGLVSADLTTRFKVPGFSLTPTLGVERVELIAPKAECEGCIGLKTQLQGDLDYKSLGLVGRATLGLGLNLDAALSVRRVDDGWTIVAQPVEIYDTHFAFDGQRQMLVDLATQPLLDWLTSRLITPGEPYQLTRIGELEAPIRRVEVRSTDEGLYLDVRTNSPVIMAVSDPPVRADGWSARLGLEALLAVARASSFRQGPIEYGIWADPNDLLIEDETFTLSIRMWKPKGGAWWRDYEIVGDFSFERGHLKLEPYEVHEIRSSPGAGRVDPLAVLAKGRILQSLAASVNTSLPSSRTHDIGGVSISWDVRSMTRDVEDLVLDGTVEYEVREE